MNSLYGWSVRMDENHYGYSRACVRTEEATQAKNEFSQTFSIVAIEIEAHFQCELPGVFFCSFVVPFVLMTQWLERFTHTACSPTNGKRILGVILQRVECEQW